MSDAPDELDGPPPDESRPEPAEAEPEPPADPEPRGMMPMPAGGVLLGPREPDDRPPVDESEPVPPQRKRLGMAPMQWRYVLVMFVTGVSVVITLALFLLIIKLVAG
jgi:hypothetical protein